MTDPKPPQDDRRERATRQPARSSLFRGMSGKLLVLTALFVMIGEVLIFVPSIANFRINWLRQRLAAAQIASLVVEATPNNIVSDNLAAELLANAQAKTIALKRGRTRQLMLRSNQKITIDEHFDLRSESWPKWILDAFKVLVASDGRTIHITDLARFKGGDFIDIVIDETPLRAAMFNFSVSILRLSIIISLITAALVFVTLHAVLVRPMRRLTDNMVRYGNDPEDRSLIIKPSRRRDEIGIAEYELAQMQQDLADTLQQKNHLAALGLAVSKISHDLRNMLASTQLLSDRLGMVDDPTVKRVAPKLLATLDRAIQFCEQTLKFGRAEETPPRRSKFVLRPLVEEILETVGRPGATAPQWRISVEPDLKIDADPGQLFRVLLNLCRNAAQALVGAEPPGIIEISARRDGAATVIEVHDNGPGLPARAREHLFEPFRGSARSGSTGLGLAIAAELVRGHHGEIALVDSERGACFQITIPDRLAEVPNDGGELRSAG